MCSRCPACATSLSPPLISMTHRPARWKKRLPVMGSYQLGRELGSEDIRSLSAFLRTMTGEWRGKRLQ
ncbi:hypothetical protein LHK_02440 [Laribacter hongkongensis HLHK9]|uniref:Uncharacterized protein n=1 Tax=Laribacter hongkongensis (strain HLHK9) TaxID=557598 RepID=C1DB83_LARHH|nr:hypothetical protein LHK_02440 [Laribacter hongkongensis HLHK9]